MKKYTPTKFKAKDSVYDKTKADYRLKHLFLVLLFHISAGHITNLGDTDNTSSQHSDSKGIWLNRFCLKCLKGKGVRLKGVCLE